MYIAFLIFAQLLLWVYDKRDCEMPNVGLVKMRDLETGETAWIDTSSKSVRKTYAKAWYDRQQWISSVMTKSGVDMTSIATDEDFVKALLGMFRRRSVAR